MGKKIDGFVVSAAAAALLYLYFQRAFENRILSGALALLGAMVLRKSLRLLVALFSRFSFLKRRRLRRLAGGTVLKLAALKEEEARAGVQALLEKCYGGEYELALVQNHPGLRLREEQIFELWRARQGAQRLVVCATCRADSACRALAATLKAPKVAIVDSEMLCQMIAEHPELFPVEQSAPAQARLRLRHLSGTIFNRRSAPRNLMLAASLTLIYVFGGGLCYLVCGMALLFIVLASLHRRPRPARLFR